MGYESRYNQPVSPYAGGTPSRSSSRGLSPTTSVAGYTPTVTPYSHPKLNIVTRVAIEGRAKKDKDGASVKMYFKFSIPTDVSPGSSVALFPEENIKIESSIVHPLDGSGAPYNFHSPDSQELLNAARALNLPSRLVHTFHAAHGLTMNSPIPSSAGSTTSALSKRSSGDDIIGPVETKYTGQILVSNYYICYVLPKTFPSPLDGSSFSHSSSSSGKRRTSFIEDKSHAHFMAAIDMWIPFASKPPRAPFLLSIPTPRCLQNNIRLRIPAPKVTSASYASLSDDDGGAWDLASEPHVTRTTSSHSLRSSSYTDFADDESSDSSTAGFADGYGLQGTFPSTERIRIRWAKPQVTVNAADSAKDGRRRAGVKDSKGEMTLVVRGQAKDPSREDDCHGVIMDVEYKSTCKGIWFPGVATLLGLDVSLSAQNSDIAWVPGFPHEWHVNGGPGYTGFDVQSPTGGKTPISRHDSLDSNSPQVFVSPSSPGGRSDPRLSSAASSRHNSASSTSSLLRAPLPGQNLAEYSFESSTSSLSQVQSPASSLASLVTSNLGQSIRPPAAPITLHLNMNELVPPAKNLFTFSISGTVLVTPRLTRPNGQGVNSDEYPVDAEPFLLPHFTLLAADSESVTTIVRNEVEDSNTTVDIQGTSGKDSLAKKNSLQRGAYLKCDGKASKIMLRTANTPTGVNGRQLHQQVGRSRTSSAIGSPVMPSRAVSPVPGKKLFPSRPRRDGPLMIPHVHLSVTPLLSSEDMFPDGYAVRMVFPSPANSDEWVEFGLAKLDAFATTEMGKKDARPPRVDIVGVSLQGVPVRYETVAAVKQEKDGQLAFEEMSGREWMSWIKVHTGSIGGGDVVVDYLVREDDASQKGKMKRSDDVSLNILLPSFLIPIGKLEVSLESLAGFEIMTLHSNFPHQRTRPNSRELLNYAVEGVFYPILGFTLQAVREDPPQSSRLAIKPWFLYTMLLSIMLGLGFILRLQSDIRHIGRIMEGNGYPVNSPWLAELPGPTAIANLGSKWWFWAPHPEPQAIPTDSAPPLTTTTASAMTTYTPTHESSLAPVASTSQSHVLGSYTHSLALLPERITALTWQDWRPLQDATNKALNKVAIVAKALWKIVQKVYHYPLEPS